MKCGDIVAGVFAEPLFSSEHSVLTWFLRPIHHNPTISVWYRERDDWVLSI